MYSRLNELSFAVMLSVEEYFDVLLEFHRKTGHVDGDRLIFASQTKYYVTRTAVKVLRVVNTGVWWTLSLVAAVGVFAAFSKFVLKHTVAAISGSSQNSCIIKTQL